MKPVAKKLALTVFIAAPLVLMGELPGNIYTQTTRGELCHTANVELRATTSDNPITIHDGTDHYHSSDLLYVGMGKGFILTDESALRVLEILAYGFLDYATRESVCGRGLFAVPARKRGRRPLHGGIAMTSVERMRKMRGKKVGAK